MCLVALALGISALWAQLPSREEIDRAVNPALSAIAKRGVSAEERIFDLGSIEPDGQHRVVFTLKNTTANTVAITHLRSSCSCLKVETKPKALKPNEKLEVVAVFNPTGRSGRVKYDIFVYTSLDTKSPTERLTITGTITPTSSHSHLPHAVGEIRLSRKSVVMDGIKVGATRSERIVVANTSQQEIKLSAHSTIEGLSLRCEPETLKPGCEGRIVVSYTAPKPMTEDIETMLILDGCSGRPTDKMIKVTIKR